LSEIKDGIDRQKDITALEQKMTRQLA